MQIGKRNIPDMGNSKFKGPVVAGYLSEGQPGSRCGHSGVGKVGQMQLMRKGMARSQRALENTAGIWAFPIRKKKISASSSKLAGL